MTIWSRPRPSRRQMLCLWLLLLALALAALGLTDLVFQEDIQKTLKLPRRPMQSLSVGPPDLEVIVDSRDRAGHQHDVGLSPLNSLQEDQLLMVLSTQRENPALLPRKESYRVVLPGSKKDSPGTVLPSHEDMEKPEEIKFGSHEKEMERSALQKYGFNEVVSERIPLHRHLPEMRNPACLTERHSDALPTASVVICFHDEAWSTLLRTVHSVLDTASKKHLREVLLVDDFSQQGYLKSVLSEYVSHLERVRLIRSMRRLGVAGCRTLGAARALGEILVFMDSHCECHRGWLEPLLERLAEDRTRVVSPIMDVINWQTFGYNATQWPVRGVFDWKLDFHWEHNRKPERGQQDSTEESPIQPVRSPVLGGGVLTIDRHFFQSVEGYDPGMLLWGAEQIELSIRVWSCGGSMEVVPCSRVAHLERHHLPYPFPDQDILQRNKVRIADTWLDAYRKIYYKRDTLAHFIRQSESPNITERVRLKKRLGCQNFHWFLSNVFPELYVPQDRPGLSGELYNVGTGYCADYSRRQGPQGGAMGIAPCSGNGNQHCELNPVGEVRWGAAGALCFNTLRQWVILTPCPAHKLSIKPQWKMIKLSGQVVHLPTQLCLEAVKEGGVSHGTLAEKGLFLRPCAHHPRQQWHFDQLVAPKAA
ncbi:polypeptide N-acetylgalactosaminyltransferase 15-like [Hypomesus transpacificus]|uniref:polypeptide N-acetylgalactosaminyltransferase 15-like n=1 Tax=Hypomesus transpacificus TaxID=137520 RepID=UPI001F074C93|nr:polypeptide N-acetylgalactosaminyltransferase 15-like [Hypomesus transpacificus]XP_046875455.1 polypeptide N-acetylgalactosaminyltransferase 15-like [Hypomesus transpacificus]XP_046875456.1 polypeptide N-acetylgalactosaminyltransferase 15-like [Hypomesus transpacificus]XP_046875457.1 polypeptide N-acetylgalactosaminyltransferase 15-like [Hypomesus transpacificus]